MIKNAIRGAIAGAAATFVMDLVTTAMYALQPPEVNEAEAAARPNGKSSVTNMLDRVETETGVTLPPERRPMIEQAVHYGLGIVPGALYGVFRGPLGVMRAGRGLWYGLALFALNDELANTKLGFAGPPDAYPWEAHFRGFAGHAVLGVATETGIQLLGG